MPPTTQPTAASLIREVQQSELWFDRLDSLLLKLSGTSIPPASRPSVSVELAFAPNRLRERTQSADHDNLRLWDGRRQTDRQSSSNRPPAYVILDHPQMGESFMTRLCWGRLADHHFWWIAKDQSNRASIKIDPDDYTITDRRTFRNVPCYVLTARSSGMIHYIDTVDHRLYGTDVRAPAHQNRRPYIEHWLSDYRELRPNCWFPMKQGFRIHALDHIPEHPPYEHAVTHIDLDPKLDDALFTPDPIPEGAHVYDGIRRITYAQKKDRTPAEFQELIDERAKIDAQQDASKTAMDALVGHPAPDFPADAKWLNSPKPLTWPALKGKPVLLLFLAEWCGPCRAKLPTLAKLQSDRTLTLLAIHPPGSPIGKITKMLQEAHLTLPLCIDTDNGTLSDAYHQDAYPYSFLIDKTGHIATHGFLDETLPEAQSLARK